MDRCIELDERVLGRVETYGEMGRRPQLDDRTREHERRGRFVHGPTEAP